MKRSCWSSIATGLLIFALLSSCASAVPRPSGESSPSLPAAGVTATPSPAKPTPTPAPAPTLSMAENTPVPVEPTATPTAVPLDFSKEPPLDEYSASIAVPDFLTEEQQDLYRRAHCLYQNMFGGGTSSIDSYFPAVETIEWEEPMEGFFVSGDYHYQPAQGRYQRWTDFDEMIHSVFTDDFWNRRSRLADGTPIYRDFDGRLGIVELERGSGNYYNENFPDEFRLEKQTEEEISFTLIGHYSWVYPREGETFEERDARLKREYECTQEFPIRMVLIENGWRFDEFHSALADE